VKRRLLVLRHAKSDWDVDYAHDFERPLAPRGRAAARAVGAWLAERGQVPDRVLCSAARRARDTLALAAGAWGATEPPTRVLDELYGASVRDVLALVAEHAGDAERLLIVGHEPTCSELVGRLTGGVRVELPTAALARIDFPGPGWSALERGVPRWLVPPKLLAPGEEG